VRIGLSVPQVAGTLSCLFLMTPLNLAMLKGAKPLGPIQWGKISPRSQYALIMLATAFTWMMGLMGYIRSVGRLEWHISELLPDRSSWAFTPSLGFAAKMVTVNMIVFWSSVFFVFWLSRWDQRVVARRTAELALPSPVVQVLSEEESA